MTTTTDLHQHVERHLEAMASALAVRDHDAARTYAAAAQAVAAALQVASTRGAAVWGHEPDSTVPTRLTDDEEGASS